ncbi:PDDEXK nuclease domain-containing protein [Bacteroidales bacterium OttesenSCG-928-K03]|nr:PDDEXK nuclease domain-containing protein [Odoribacter sp. OttesenSCG-928-L07]MDL2239648.1 PDDEXK nuclease domain-containing protein [Bacteroidales bacterium OttesenSCG-928-L14]MDL2243019.1 PDDEXK nuclease domain-containing protein [Bacteroidales bacterium OttesenSCG-928-K03]
MNISDNSYKKWILELKTKIRSTQIKAAIAVNSALIEFYWELGKMISEKENVWGNKLIEQAAKDLQSEFPDMKGLSRSNLFYCKQFYVFYHDKLIQQPVGQIVQQPVTKIPLELGKGFAFVGQQTIGILLCREKNSIEVEFSLRDINKPMGVSEFQITEHLPKELKDSLPTIEEIENEFIKLRDENEQL